MWVGYMFIIFWRLTSNFVEESYFRFDIELIVPDALIDLGASDDGLNAYSLLGYIV